MFYGADTEQVRRWADLATAHGQTLGGDIQDRFRMALQVTWEGSDAEDFRSRIHDLGLRLNAATARLAQLGDEVLLHAEEQDEASKADTGVMGDPPPQERDQSGDPTGGPGEYVPYLPLEDGMTAEESERIAEQWIDPDAVEQGSVGDCGLMASLMGIAQHDPDLLRENLVRNDDGTWTVTLYRDGEPVEIVVDSTVPAQGAHSIVPADLDGDGVMDEQARYFSWVSIYEKALAEYTSTYGDSSYEELDNGAYGDEYMEILTGNSAQRTGESDFEDLSSRLAEGPVSVTTELPREWWRFAGDVDDPTIVPNHEYNVHGMIPAGTPAPDGSVSGEDRIHLDNPWGPDGDGGSMVGDVYLTEQQYKDNFRAASSVPRS